MTRKLDMTNLDPHLLRAFVAVADIGTMVGASVHLNRTQAAVSMQIKKLEEHIGKVLFDRAPRGLKLTADGQMLMSYARNILALNDEFGAHVAGRVGKGRLRLGVNEDFAYFRLVPMLEQYRRDYPAIEIDVLVEPNRRLAAMFENAQADVVICDVGHINRKPLGVWNETLTWVTSTELVIDRSAPLPVIMFEDSCPWRGPALSALARAGADWRIVSEASTLVAMAAAVRVGLGACPMMPGTIPPGCRTIQPVVGFNCLVDITIGVFADGHPSPEARYFVDMLTGQAPPFADPKTHADLEHVRPLVEVDE